MTGAVEVVDVSAAPVLRHLLDEAAGFHPEYHDGLSNHLPMALIALYGLGANGEELLSFYRTYSPRLETLSQSDTRDLGRPSARLGTDSTHLTYLHEIIDHARKFGFEEARRQAIYKLGPGIGAAAFHGLIRTSYGIEDERPAEELVGFAYWSQRYLALAETLPIQGSMSLKPWLARITDAVQRYVADGHAIEGYLIHERMGAVAQMPGFGELLNELDIEATMPLDFAKLATKLYLSSLNFTVLHLVTSAHALQVVSRYASDPLSLRHWYAVAFAAALATVDQGVFSGQPTDVAILDWSEIRDRAIASMDDHVIKLCYTLSELDRLEHPFEHTENAGTAGDADYQIAASRCLAAHQQATAENASSS